MSYVKYQILEEAYDHYQRSWNEKFTFLPKSPEYLVNVINTVPTLMNNGFITDVSNNLLECNSISLTPPEYMSFTITSDGIEYVRSGRNS